MAAEVVIPSLSIVGKTDKYGVIVQVRSGFFVFQDLEESIKPDLFYSI
jgi:hypothetical protein